MTVTSGDCKKKDSRNKKNDAQTLGELQTSGFWFQFVLNVVEEALENKRKNTENVISEILIHYELNTHSVVHTIMQFVLCNRDISGYAGRKFYKWDQTKTCVLRVNMYAHLTKPFLSLCVSLLNMCLFVSCLVRFCAEIIIQRPQTNVFTSTENIAAN